jgi:hypothetical protein
MTLLTFQLLRYALNHEWIDYNANNISSSSFLLLWESINVSASYATACIVSIPLAHVCHWYLLIFVFNFLRKRVLYLLLSFLLPTAADFTLSFSFHWSPPALLGYLIYNTALWMSSPCSRWSSLLLPCSLAAAASLFLFLRPLRSSLLLGLVPSRLLVWLHYE